MLAVIFPGQGSQSLGMSKDFYDNFELVRQIFAEIKEKTKIDVENIIFNDPKNQLNITEFSQISIYSASISMFSVINSIYGSKFLNNIAFVAGHSLGEYTALAAAKVINILECAELLKFRGIYMQNSYPENESGMLAVIGCDIKDIESIITENEDNNIFEIANDNAPGQVVISLKKNNFDKASSLLVSKGAKRVIPLNVSAAFHSSYMKQAEDKMIKKLDETIFNNAIYPIVSNYSANPSKDSKDIKNNVKKQILNRVRWVETIKFFEANNVSTIVEIGPNKVLNNLNKRISSNLKLINVSSVADLESIKNVI
ncbi:MAG: Malonyl CoA-acyl carrier protein transacylase [Alphaproteobacteria bacterium MarineAlpha5_Bin11]|nr:MAG: Malonyl CoA-acyl carrier protein transacylase [Alphaproteobacteria bacterium MarineAlpha5_Bin11]|tara:strand:- start:59 stop:997 length:939 start_codon:yes stop_codon:yes gene_type:complete